MKLQFPTFTPRQVERQWQGLAFAAGNVVGSAIFAAVLGFSPYWAGAAAGFVVGAVLVGAICTLVFLWLAITDNDAHAVRGYDAHREL